MKALKKVNNEIEKIESQIQLLQTRLQELKAQRTQLENAEMIAAIRDAKFDANDMLAVIAAMKKGGKGLSEFLPAENTEQEDFENDQNI